MKRVSFLTSTVFAALGYGSVTAAMGALSRLPNDLNGEVLTVSRSEVSSAIEKIIELADGAVRAEGNELRFKVNGRDQKIILKTI